ncbi:MAG: hypothetical protein JWM19_2598 [Actinomycetia bacterium]|nr:hypothetical protein [Actinomycetes bacterium]
MTNKNLFMPGDNMGGGRREDGQPYAVTVSPVEGLLISSHNGTGSVSVSLPVAPVANVTVNVTILDAGYGLTTANASLTFTTSNYSTPQTVTFTATNGGSFRVLFQPVNGTNVPGYQSTAIRVQAS